MVWARQLQQTYFWLGELSGFTGHSVHGGKVKPSKSHVEFT